jgi:hypothetical protein
MTDTTNCGGCQNLGSHRRWCRNKVGLSASIYGPMAERLESIGDTVGPNHMGLSNKLWQLSGEMREWAESLRDTHQASEVKGTH